VHVLAMRGNRSWLDSFGAIGITTPLLCGSSAAAETAETAVPAVAPNAAGASPSAVRGGSASASELVQGVVAGATGSGGRLAERPAAAHAQTVGPFMGHLTPMDPNRASRRLRVTTGDASRQLSSSATGARTSGSAAPGQSFPQAKPTAAPVNAGAPATVRPSPPSGARGAVPLAHPGPPASPAPRRHRPSDRAHAGPGSTHPPLTNPAAAPGATRYNVTQPVATSATPAPSASQPVASSPSAPAPPAPRPVATAPAATGPVAAGPVATKPVATPPAAGRSSLAVAAESLHLLASPNEVGTAKASKAASARRLKRSFMPAPPVSPPGPAPRSMPEVGSYAPPAQTRLPIGGATGDGSGGLAPPHPCRGRVHGARPFARNDPPHAALTGSCVLALDAPHVATRAPCLTIAVVANGGRRCSGARCIAPPQWRALTRRLIPASYRDEGPTTEGTA
jgi:hypothetical protein